LQTLLRSTFLPATYPQHISFWVFALRHLVMDTRLVNAIALCVGHSTSASRSWRGSRRCDRVVRLVQFHVTRWMWHVGHVGIYRRCIF
jgi:hypothetical protein